MIIKRFGPEPPAMSYARAFITRLGLSLETDFEHEEDILVFENEEGFRITVGMIESTIVQISFAKNGALVELWINGQDDKHWRDIHAKSKKDQQVALEIVQQFLLPLIP